MTRVFISFASEDAAVAERLDTFWTALGVVVFRFDDPARPAGRVVGEIERRLEEADVFVALLSPHYLGSTWCVQERDLAIQREADTGKPSVHVIKVTDTPAGESGLLRNYHWVDATSELSVDRLNAISARLPLGVGAAAAAEAVASATIPEFRNRDDELANLRGALATRGGRELWVVVAPPLMGKTWLLTRLEQTLAGADPHWTVRHLDLRKEPAELRSNPARLVGAILDVDVAAQQGPLLDDELRDVAAQVSFRKGPQLFVLDSAELLTPACASTARSALTAVRGLIRETGWDGRFAMVVGTRRHDEWRGLGSDARTGERFEALRLTEFGRVIVHQALRDLKLRFGENELWRHADRLHALTEGLPALLVKSVQWAQATAFLRMRSLGRPGGVRRGRTRLHREDLLSAESLLPMGSAQSSHDLTVLREMLRVLSTYRLYTQSHLKFHLDADPALQRALADARWTRVDLWEALGHTALGTRRTRTRSGTRSSRRCAVCCTATTTAPTTSGSPRTRWHAASTKGGPRTAPPVANNRSSWWRACGTRRRGWRSSSPASWPACCPASRWSSPGRSVVHRCTSRPSSARRSSGGCVTTTSSRCSCRATRGLSEEIVKSVSLHDRRRRVTIAAGTYVPRREEEAAIRQQVEKVRADGKSRAVLLHGPGGAGKTMLVRNLADRLQSDASGLVWIEPIDVDDSEYWLLSNLETAVAKALGREHFTPYFEHLDRIARLAHEYVSYETVLAQLSRINRTFVDCYRTYVRTSKTTVVLTLDTIEAIRSMYLLLTLTQWMKELPHTLFILSGRPPGEHEPGDPLREELDDPHRPLEYIEVPLRGFADDEARRFLQASGMHDSLTDVERNQLIDLTSRQPLWLALAIEYLQEADPPSEMTSGTAPTDATRESFRRKLVTLYRSTDFWPEAIKRLAVVRHSVTQQVWSELMADRGLPADADDWAHAWELLLRRPWVRARANKRYVTLHDALAEELAKRVIPLHDQDGAWRNELWHRAKNIYAQLTEEQDERVVAGLTRVGTALESADAGAEGLVAEVSSVDAQKRELDQLLTAQLHYAILDDFSAGTDRFLELFQRAEDRRDPLFMELICHEMEKFLPRPGSAELPDEVLDLALEQYRRWLQTEAPGRYGAIAVQIAGFLVRNEQPAVRTAIAAEPARRGRGERRVAVPARDRAGQREHAHSRPGRCGASVLPRRAGPGPVVGGRRRTRASRSGGAQGARLLLPQPRQLDRRRRRVPHGPRCSRADHGPGQPGEVPRGNGLHPDQLGVPQGVARRVPRGPQPRRQRHRGPQALQQPATASAIR